MQKLNIDPFTWQNCGAGLWYINKHGHYPRAAGLSSDFATFEWNQVSRVDFDGVLGGQVRDLLKLTDAEGWYCSGDDLYIHCPASKTPRIVKVEVWAD